MRTIIKRGCLAALALSLIAAACAFAEGWTCANCGQTGNTGKFCPNCAAAAPAEGWTCASCGQSGNTGNYCTNCASPRPGAARPQVPVNANLEQIPTVYEGDTVSAGDVIGSVGETAKCESAQDSHLHLSAKLNGESVNPVDYLPQKS